jgi:hypothetical protein
MKSTAVAAESRFVSWALAALFWFVPLWAIFAALDPERPGLPLIAPRNAVLVFGVVALVDFAIVAIVGLRAKQPRAVRIAFLSGGVVAIVTGLCGFDPVTGVAFGIGAAGVELGGLAISAAGPQTTRLCLRAFLWSSLCACLAALVMLGARHPAALYEYDNARAVGTFLNPNELAAYTVVALGGAVPLAIYARDRLASVTAIVLAATLAATFSRWGIVSAACGVAAFALATRSRSLLGATIGIALAGFALNAALGARHHNPVDLEMRGAAWSVGIATFERFPLTGVGALAFGRTYDAMRTPDAPGSQHPIAFDPHSIPISVAASGGIVSLVTLLASTIFLQRRVYFAAARAPGASRFVAIGLASGLIGLYVDCLPNTIVIFFPLMYQTTALALALSRNAAVAE